MQWIGNKTHPQRTLEAASTSFETYLSLLLILSLLTVIGNGLVILVVLKDPNKNLKTKATVFLINLAVADLLLGLVIEPILLVLSLYYTSNNYHEYLDVVIYVMEFAVQASCLTLIALAIQRWMLVEFPLRVHQLLTPKHLKITIAMIWITSALITFLTIITAKDLRDNSKEKYNDIFVYDIVGSILIITMVCVYGRICVLVRRSLNFCEPSTVDGDERQHLVTNNQAQSMRRARISEAKVTNTCFIVCGVFIVCWLPAHLYFEFTNKDDTIGYGICIVIGLINSAVNPVIYSLRSAKFKQALKVLLNTLKLKQNK